MAVAVGDLRRKKEAMELLVGEIAKGEENQIPSLVREVIEVRVRIYLRHSYFFLNINE